MEKEIGLCPQCLEPIMKVGEVVICFVCGSGKNKAGKVSRDSLKTEGGSRRNDEMSMNGQDSAVPSETPQKSGDFAQKGPWKARRSILRLKKDKLKARARDNAKLDKAAGKVKINKISRKRLVAQLDQLWSLAVRLNHKRNYGPMCRICGKNYATLAYHIVAKQRGHSIRWIMANGCGACTQCNYGEVTNRPLYRQKHIDIFGKDLIEQLEGIAATHKAPSLDEMLKMKEAFNTLGAIDI